MQKSSRKKRMGFWSMLLAIIVLCQGNGLTVLAETVSGNEAAEEVIQTVSGEMEYNQTEEGEQNGTDEGNGEFAVVKTGEVPEGTPENPTHICTMQDDGTDTTEWSYVYFGSYPKSIVTDRQMIEAIEAKIAEIASEGSDYAGTKADTGTDVWVDGIKYRRITIRDVNSTENWLENYEKYRYYKWERIKWRVLQNDGTNLFLMADEILDCQNYNSTSQNTMWLMSTIRTWLNSSFYHTAFNSGEQNAIISWNVENVNNPMTGLEAGGYTEDRIYLLSIAEAMNSIYGFCEKYDTRSVSRQLICSDYAYARGTYRAAGDVKGWWWLRSPGVDYDKAASVHRRGFIITDGEKVNSSNTGVAPVLHIKLSSDVWFMEDDGTSGEGGEDTVESTVTGYHGCYDGKAHGITVTVTDPADGKLTYSTDGIHYSEEAPQFVDVGTYTVYYKIQKDGYRTATGSDTVAITKRNITIAAENQTVLQDSNIEQNRYKVSSGSLAEGDKISGIILTPNTSEPTEQGNIHINGAKMVNAACKDVTANYHITYADGRLVVICNTFFVRAEAKISKNTLTITWKKIDGAEGYDIFAAPCGKNKQMVKRKTVNSSKTSATLKKISGKKISMKTPYKVCVKAYRNINGKKEYIGKSLSLHLVGSENKTYTNTKTIKISKSSYSLETGKTVKIKASIVKQDKRKKLLLKEHGAKLRYTSSNTSIATVSSTGKIKAVKKGTCYVYVTALNGISKKIKVTVK